MMRHAVALAAAGAALVGSASRAAVSEKDFLFRRELVPPSQRTEGAAAVTLDDAVFAGTDNRYANLRIFEEGGREVPFIVRAATEKRDEAVEEAVPVAVQSLQELPDNRIVIVLRRDRPEAPEGVPAWVEVVTAARDFEKSVHVSGCDDGTNWTATGEGAVIFDYSRYMDVRSCRAGLAGSWRRFYRIEIGNITETQRSPWLEISKEIRAGAEAGQNERSVVWSRSLRIEQIRLYARVERKVVERERRQPYAVAVSAVSEDKAKKRTVVILKASRQPLCLLALQTSDPVFSRAVKVEGTDDAEGRQGWLDVGGATITRLRAGGVQQENAGIGLPCPSRYLWYRLTIANLDSPPLQVSGVTATGQVCEAVFFPGAMKRGVLLYGGTGIPAPVYDLQRMAGSLLTAESDRWSLGPETANPGGRGGRRTLSGKTLLVGAVVAMVFVLGWVIAGAARRMPPGGAGEP